MSAHHGKEKRKEKKKEKKIGKNQEPIRKEHNHGNGLDCSSSFFMARAP